MSAFLLPGIYLQLYVSFTYGKNNILKRDEDIVILRRDKKFIKIILTCIWVREKKQINICIKHIIDHLPYDE